MKRRQLLPLSADFRWRAGRFRSRLAWLLGSYWAATLLHLRLYAVHPLRLAQVVLRPGQVGLTLLLLLRLGAQRSDLSLAIAGAGMVGIWTALLGTASFTVLRERFYYGTVPLLVGAPCPLAWLMAGFLTGELVIALPALGIGFLLALVLGGHGPGVQVNPLSFGGSLLVGSLGLITFCLLLSALLVLNAGLTRWYNALEYPTWILGGFLFPITLLPPWVQPLCLAFSPYWVAQVLQRSIAGAPPAALWPAWSLIGALALLQGVLASWLYRFVSWRARQTGALLTE